MKAPIAIVFANLKGNVGDFAILEAMLRDISSRYAGHPIHVYHHGYLALDQQRLKVFASTAPPFEVAGATYFRHPSLLAKAGALVGMAPSIQERMVRRLADASAADAKRFAGYGAIFFAGGNQWGGQRLGLAMFATLAAISRHNPNVFAYPFSIEHGLASFNSDEFLREHFALLKGPLVVRDGASQVMLQKLGLRSVRGYDVVFSLGDVVAGISPAADRDPDRVLLVVTHKRKLEAALKAVVPRLAAAGRRVELLTTCWNVDEPAYRAVSSELGIPYRAPLSWRDVVAEFKSSALVVTNRLHGMILGALSGARLLPVADREKIRAFVGDAGMSNVVGTIEQITPASVAAAQHDAANAARAAEYVRLAAGGTTSPVA
jgi:polysaccharide pyruvyl transferase WcaK-like protein